MPPWSENRNPLWYASSHWETFFVADGIHLQATISYILSRSDAFNKGNRQNGHRWTLNPTAPLVLRRRPSMKSQTRPSARVENGHLDYSSDAARSSIWAGWDERVSGLLSPPTDAPDLQL